ncbi:MAG: SGNH/GDSL hydrolase family protein, partial [Terriglobia bacterium]
LGAVLLLQFSLVRTAAAASGNFYLHSGDRVVFYGDSITDQRLYTSFIETYVITRFPRLKVSFVNSGWGGDTVGGGGGGPIDVRLSRDVSSFHPTVMTIMLGMNDGGYEPFNQKKFDTFSTGYQHIVDSVKKALPGIRITAIEPSPFDDVTSPATLFGKPLVAYNEVLIRYGQFVQALGKKDGLEVADFNAPVVNVLKKAMALDPPLARKIIPDRIHPAPAGHMVMAEALLKAWGAPSTVTAVVIDAGNQRVEEEQNTRVEHLAQNGVALSWTQMDGSLPMPVDQKNPLVKLVLRSSDFVKALDQEELSVKRLSAPSYVLKIDGKSAGVFTSQDLEAGINLAVLPTPMAAQAQQVHKLTLEHNDLHGASVESIQVPSEGGNWPHRKEALKALDQLEQDMVERQRADAQPKLHHYTLTPAAPAP